MAFDGAPEVVEFFRMVDSSSYSLSNSLQAAVSRVLRTGTLGHLFNNDCIMTDVDATAIKPHRLSGQITDIRALEHQTLKVPYEILNKKFRHTQKTIDRDISHVQYSVNELEKVISKSRDVESDKPVTIGQINELLSGVVNKLTVLKRKSIECFNDEMEAANVCKRRLDHLKEYCVKSQEIQQDSLQDSNDKEDQFMVDWKRKRMDRMLVDHCLRAGYYNTAMELAKSSEIDHLTNIDIFLVCKEIEESLIRHETTRCLMWCHDNRSKLRKIKSTLEFSLRQQEFIELVRNNQRVEAVKYAQRYFSNLEDLTVPSAQQELQRVMGLLACTSNTQNERYRKLFDLDRWNHLVEQFRQENFKLYQLSQESIFAMTLQAGLSALKTPQCYRKDGTRNSECPVCSELLNKLAKDLPCAHCSQSRLVCFISGEAMNEHNQPLMLPNGYVYGEHALRKMAEQNEGKITCPRTSNIYDISEAEKVYVM